VWGPERLRKAREKDGQDAAGQMRKPKPEEKKIGGRPPAENSNSPE